MTTQEGKELSEEERRLTDMQRRRKRRGGVGEMRVESRPPSSPDSSMKDTEC